MVGRVKIVGRQERLLAGGVAQKRFPQEPGEAAKEVQIRCKYRS